MTPNRAVENDSPRASLARESHRRRQASRDMLWTLLRTKTIMPMPATKDLCLSTLVGRVAIAISIVLASVAKAEPPDQVGESLKRSQFCARAAKEFFEPQKADAIAESITYTSHFNKALNKCLVKIQRILLVKESSNVLEMNHIYDALEGKVLGGKILTKKMVKGEEPNVVGIMLLKDGKTIRDPDEAAAVVLWFDRLMDD